MKILFCGDVVGKSGRKALLDHLPTLQASLKPDFVVVNGENAAHGFGITGKICESFYEAGVDVITTGNHVWDQREIITYIDGDKKLLRPLNYRKGTPGRGGAVYELVDGRKVLVVQLICRLFMKSCEDPFESMEKILQLHPLGRSVNAIIIDLHGEATSEKVALGHVADGRASVVAGTHTHIPTADTQILENGTAFQTDLGMCGDYNSVIGMAKSAAIGRFTTNMPGEKLIPATGEATICGMFVETDDKTGLAIKSEPVRIGGRLTQQIPT